MVNRYYLKECKDIWSEESKYNNWLKVELSLLKALNTNKLLKKEEYSKILKNISFNTSDIQKYEKETNHDVFAFIKAISKNLGNEQKWIHYGITSTDIVDTSLSISFKKINNLIENFLLDLLQAIKTKAIKYKNTLTIGRTHGMHGEFTSFGYKFAIWYKELKDAMNNFIDSRQYIEVCKLSGAVGNFAHISPKIEEYVAKDLKLIPVYNSTQVVSRINHVYYLSSLNIISLCCSKIALEMRHLSRTEVGEITEAFKKNQKGSSAMPHKQNPIGFEKISGLTRYIKTIYKGSIDNVDLWHERDISHSSFERYLFPDITSTLVYVLKTTSNLIINLNINKKRIKENYLKSCLIPFSQRLMLYLIKEKNVTRIIAHDLTQQIMRDNCSIEKILLALNKKNIAIKKFELENIFSHKYYLQNIDYIYKKILH